MVDVFFPDRSQWQQRKVAKSPLLVCARASEGNWLTDPEYGWNAVEARRQGARFFAYHFLESGSSAGSQATWAHAIAGKVPLMVDLEPILGTGAQGPATNAGTGAGHYCGQAWHELVQASAGTATAAGDPDPDDVAGRAAAAAYVSKPGLALAEEFITAYRKLGGVCHDVYLPHWYWQVLGSPSLTGLAKMGVWLTSSQYTTYSHSGPGWAGYGGLVPQVWQYSDNGPGGFDYNAFRGQAPAVGGAVGELWSLLTTGTRSAARPVLKRFDVPDGSSLNTVVRSHPGNGVAGALGHTWDHNNNDWPDPLRAYVNAGDWEAQLPNGTRLWLWQEA